MRNALRNLFAALVCLAAPAPVHAGASPCVYADWAVFTTHDGLPHDAVRSLMVHGAQVWVGTEAGLAVLEGDRWQTWTHRDPQRTMPLPVISALALDPATGDVWLGTWGSGLLRLSAGRFERIDQLNSGLAGNLVFAVLAADGHVWAATNGGLSIFDPLHHTWDLLLERRADRPELPLLNLVPAPGSADVYAAAWCAGLYRIDRQHGRASAVPAPWAPEADTTLGVTQADGTTWWITQTHLGRCTASAPWEMRPIANFRPPHGSISCAAARSTAEVWLGTERGLHGLADWPSDTWITYRRGESGSTTLATVTRAGETIETHTLQTGLPDNRIHCVAFQGADLWVGTAHGLAHGKRGQEPSASAPPAAAPPTTKVSDNAPASKSPAIVPIGVLSLVSRKMPLPGQSTQPSTAALVDVLAVQLAVEEANERGGYRGTVPFAVVTAPDEYTHYGWTLPEDDLATLAYTSPVSGLVGCVGPAQRFTSAAVRRTGVPLVNAADAPPTVSEALNPWMFHSTDAACDDPAARARFAARFTARFQLAPRTRAFASYLAAERLLRAIEAAGPDRDAIRRTLDEQRTTLATQPAGARPP